MTEIKLKRLKKSGRTIYVIYVCIYVCNIYVIYVIIKRKIAKYTSIRLIKL